MKAVNINRALRHPGRRHGDERAVFAAGDVVNDVRPGGGDLGGNDRMARADADKYLGQRGRRCRPPRRTERHADAATVEIIRRIAEVAAATGTRYHTRHPVPACDPTCPRSPMAWATSRDRPAHSSATSRGSARRGRRQYRKAHSGASRLRLELGAA